jgi:hypothetical protein
MGDDTYSTATGKIRTLWSGFPVENSEYTAGITTYMDMIKPVVSTRVLPQNLAIILMDHVQENFIDNMINLVKSAQTDGMGPENCKKLLEWATRVWDWILQPYTKINKDRSRRVFKRKMNNIVL